MLDYHLRKTSPTSPVQVAAIISASLHYWHRPSLKLTAPAGKLARSPRFFLSISGIYSEPAGRDFIFIGVTFKLRHRHPDGDLGACRIEFDTESQMSCETLEAHYPGSVDRLSMGLSIGLNAAELVTQLLGDETLQAVVTLPDLNDTVVAR